MTGPEKTGLIYTKYTCSYYGTYLVFWMCYVQYASFITFLIDLCMYGETCAIIQNTIKKLLQFKHSKLDQIVHVDKTGFLRPSHILCFLVHIIHVTRPAKSTM